MSSSNNSQNMEPLKATFLGNGVIKLYNEFLYNKEPFQPSQEGSSSNPNNAKLSTTPGDGTMISIISLPTYFTATDLLGFIGDSYINSISHIRILKSEKPNRFLVLIKFNDSLKAAEFQYTFNGKAFNSMEPETCNVIFVDSVNFISNNHENSDSLIPFLLVDPFTSPSDTFSVESTSNNMRNSINAVHSMRELPTCPVCLERMDSNITGLLTIPCQHTFHCQCLSKWKDDTCPICRYSNNFSKNLNRNRLASNTDGNTCSQCEIDNNLWICLLCGNLGCGRYDNQHSLAHFNDTNHCFSMDINSQRVWDYVGDNYVHRLLTNLSDGKLVELSDKPSNEDNNKSKMDDIGLEYSNLVISQLESQREYYEKKFNEYSNNIMNLNNRNTELVYEINNLSLNSSKLQELDKKLSSYEKKFEKLLQLNQGLQKSLSEENALNNALSIKIDALTEKNNSLQADNEDLQEQVKDLMFYLESQEKFKDASDDVKEGTVVIQERAQKSKNKNKNKKK